MQNHNRSGNSIHLLFGFTNVAQIVVRLDLLAGLVHPPTAPGSIIASQSDTSLHA